MVRVRKGYSVCPTPLYPWPYTFAPYHTSSYPLPCTLFTPDSKEVQKIPRLPTPDILTPIPLTILLCLTPILSLPSLPQGGKRGLTPWHFLVLVGGDPEGEGLTPWHFLVLVGGDPEGAGLTPWHFLVLEGGLRGSGVSGVKRVSKRCTGSGVSPSYPCQKGYGHRLFTSHSALVTLERGEGVLHH